ncbi:MAG: hypothetical protein JXQ97_16320 [Natronospirillum sp.]
MRNPIVKLVIFLIIMAVILVTLVVMEQRRRQPEFSPVFFSQAPTNWQYVAEVANSAWRPAENTAPIA